MKEKIRENNYDLLRIVSCIAVILLHVSAIYFIAINSNPGFSDTIINNHSYIVFMNMIPRFAVPCFVMLSGAFLIANDKNMDRKSFYKKSIKSLIVPFLIISVLYILYNEINQTILYLNDNSNIKGFWYPIRDALMGVPGYHLWYVSMLIGLYAITPDIIKYTRKIEEHKNSKYIFAAIIILSLISGYYTDIKFYFGIPSFAIYIGYYISGYLIRKNTKNKSNLKGMLYIVTALLLYLIQAIIYTKLELWNSQNELLTNMFGKKAFQPFPIITSFLIFKGFAYLNIKNSINFGSLPKDTFYIYLVHVFVVDTLDKLLKSKIGNVIDVKLAIPLYTAVTFLLSLIITKIYLVIFNWVNKGDELENKIIKLLKLDK